MIIAWHRSHEASKRLDAIPGVGPVLATALIASIADQGLSLRPQLLGLDWTGAEAALEWGQGQARQYQQTRDRYLRSLFMAGALAVIRYARIHGAGICRGSRHCWRWIIVKAFSCVVILCIFVHVLFLYKA